MTFNMLLNLAANIKKFFLLALYASICISSVSGAQATQISSSSRVNPLWKSWSNSLPLDLAEQVRHDALVLSEYEANLPALRDSKRRTRFYACTRDVPRTASEVAMIYLLNLTVANNGLDRARIVGCEYWFQRVTKASAIGFHVDKDESIASNKHYLVHPLWSSIYYLTDFGGGTLITDQFSPHGNGYDPQSPELGAWSFPQYNKFTIFNGSLLHGVVSADPSQLDLADNRDRITFLINFWLEVPETPNCDILRHETVKGLRQFSVPTIRSMLSGPQLARRIKPINVNLIPHFSGQISAEDTELYNSKRPVQSYNFKMNLPGQQFQHIDLPLFYNNRVANPGATYQLIWHEKHKTKLRKGLQIGNNSENSENSGRNDESNEQAAATQTVQRNEEIPSETSEVKEDLASLKAQLKQKLSAALKEEL
jgi:hypothetical protein